MLLCENNFFSQNNLFYVRYFSELVCFNQNSVSNPAIIACLDFYCSLSVGIVMTVISIFSCNLKDNLKDNSKDSLMIYICGKFELPNYKSKVEIRTSSFSPRIIVQR